MTEFSHMQVRIPDTGGRLIVASDGLWDGFENMKRLCRMSRGWACQVNPTPPPTHPTSPP